MDGLLGQAMRRARYTGRTGHPAGHDTRPENSDPLFLANLLKAVSEKFNLSKEALKSERKFAPYVAARGEFCYRAYTECNASLVRIGKAIGGKDHTTVRNAIAKHCMAHGLGLPEGINWAYWQRHLEPVGFVSVGSVAVRVVENLERQRADDPQKT